MVVGERIIGIEDYYKSINGMKCLYQSRIGIETHKLSVEEVKNKTILSEEEYAMPKFVRPNNLRPLASGNIKIVDPQKYREE